MIAAMVIALIILYYKQYPYKIIKHCDGDTSWIKPLWGKKFKVRYGVIDANESRQAGGKEATQYLNKILPVGSRISIIPTSKCKSYDRDLIGTVYKGWTNINLQMLKSGHAVIDPDYLDDIDWSMQERYIKAQNRAKYKKLGRWGNPSHCNQEPKQWRKHNLNRYR